MTTRVVVSIQTHSCPEPDGCNNCLECPYFCGIKKAQFDFYEIECGAKPEKKGVKNG